MIRTKNLIHPGEILKEEFLDPWESARTAWRSTCTSPRPA